MQKEHFVLQRGESAEVLIEFGGKVEWTSCLEFEGLLMVNGQSVCKRR